jgi:tetraacyldisaccharide 4'-kinase
VTTGYKRREGGTVSITSPGGSVSAAQAGDEAVMLWQMTGAPIHVGDDVTEVIRRVAHEPAPDFIVLDDGVRRRWRGEERIVVLTPEDIERPVRFLPDGRWRIPPQRVWPASGVAIVQIGQAVSSPVAEGIRDHHESILRAWGYGGPVAWYVSVADGLVRLPGGSADSSESPVEGNPFVFCGLGSPSRFARQLDLMGMKPAGMQRFPDHHAYSAADMIDLERRCRQAKARWMLTTHKDAVKIDPAWTTAIPVYWLRIRLELAAGVDMLSVILETPK